MTPKGIQLEVGDTWSKEYADQYFDIYAGNNPAHKAGAGGKQKQHAGGKKRSGLITKWGLQLGVAALVSAVNFLDAAASAPGFAQWAEGIKKENPRAVKDGGTKVHEYILSQGKGHETNSVMWKFLADFSHEVILSGQDATADLPKRK